MSYTIAEESLDSLSSCWTDYQDSLIWPSVFVSPLWLRVWWQVFGSGSELFLRTVRQGKNIAGIAPFMVKDKTASFVGSADVCDYLDFILAPGDETGFFNALLDYLKGQGIEYLELNPVRADSAALNGFVTVAQGRGCEVVSGREDVSLEMDLPSGWEEYLESLTTKQRHEVRRKMRRLSEFGRVDYCFIEEKSAVNESMETFFRLFTVSRQDKAEFLTAPRESFFRLLAETLAENEMLRLGTLSLDDYPAAMIMCFDYDDCLYLYNSGYDPEYNSSSAGLMSKVLAIKDSIERGKKRFDFLKGAEHYKYQLGGKEVPIYNCRIAIK